MVIPETIQIIGFNFLRIRPSLHSHGAQQHTMHAVAGMEK
jgi:hypothetical protein